MPVPSRRRLLIALGVLLVLVVSFVALQRPEPSAASQNVRSLAPPGLVRSAKAADNQALSDIAAEAGISAYYQAPGNINLTLVEDDFKTIEIQTGTYIIGSVDIIDYEDEFGPHVYVDEAGWILAYYLKDDPVAKMVDTKGNTVNNTLLKEAVSNMASAAGQPFVDVNYYDFRYPNATHMMFVGETHNTNDESFTIELPASYGYFERSWAAIRGDLVGLNGADVSITYNGSTDFGYITAGELPVGQTHTVSIRNTYVALVIVYVVP